VLNGARPDSARPELCETLPPPLLDLVRHMWDAEPTQRPQVDKVREALRAARDYEVGRWPQRWRETKGRKTIMSSV
jgi:hypothetical protein